MQGFFPSSELISKAPVSLIPKCGACGLLKQCKTPKMPVSGEGRRGVLIVGEAPGRNEDEQGMQFVGDAGAYLKEALNFLDVKLRRDCWVTNALICRPPDNKIDDDAKVDYCRPNLLNTIKELKPSTIILLGHTAVKSLVAHVWKDEVGPMGRWAGWRIPCTKPNAWICPTWHPSYLNRLHDPVMDRQFEKHLEDAFKLRGRPWDVLPNYGAQVEVILDPDEAAKIIYGWLKVGGRFALDYENNCLKPETKGGAIICASICWEGKRTIAFPWTGSVIEAVRCLVHADNCWFIASNLKHEDRWTRKAYGRGVRHWLFDIMLAAHTLDNRTGGICGLKFQAFVRLGAEAYDDKLKQFMAPRDGQVLNELTTEVSLTTLLRYCGIDTLLEFLLYLKQDDDLTRF